MMCSMTRVRGGRPNPGWRWAANDHRSTLVFFWGHIFGEYNFQGGAPCLLRFMKVLWKRAKFA